MAVRDVIEITKVEQNAGSEIVFLCFHVRFCTRVDKKKKKKEKKKRARERSRSFSLFDFWLLKSHSTCSPRETS